MSLESSSGLANKALCIVLQHLMIPDLGWYMTIYESSLPKLRESIVESRFVPRDTNKKKKTVDDASQIAQRKEFKLKLENELGYFDETFVATLTTRLQSVNAQHLLRSIGSSYSNEQVRIPESFCIYICQPILTLIHFTEIGVRRKRRSACDNFTV
jgi:hypothetical protein